MRGLVLEHFVKSTDEVQEMISKARQRYVLKADNLQIALRPNFNSNDQGGLGNRYDIKKIRLFGHRMTIERDGGYGRRQHRILSKSTMSQPLDNCSFNIQRVRHGHVAIGVPNMRYFWYKTEPSSSGGNDAS